MLSPQEALLLKAAYDEQDRIQQQNTAGLLGAVGGSALGVAGGQIPHALSNLMGGKAKTSAGRMRPGFRAAGGLTGAILGGALGAGVAGIMKSESPAARLMGKLQAGGDIDEYDRMQLANELASIYNNPSKLGM
jgi:hypothetical protein